MHTAVYQNFSLFTWHCITALGHAFTMRKWAWNSDSQADKEAQNLGINQRNLPYLVFQNSHMMNIETVKSILPLP